MQEMKINEVFLLEVGTNDESVSRKEIHKAASNWVSGINQGIIMINYRPRELRAHISVFEDEDLIRLGKLTLELFPEIKGTIARKDWDAIKDIIRYK